MYKNFNIQFFISYLGFLPYLIIIIDKFFLQKIEIKILESFNVYYSIIILVFIGSINWNLEEKVSKKKVLYGFFPSCVSVFIIIIYKNGSHQKVYYFVRLPLTILIVFSLIIIQ